ESDKLWVRIITSKYLKETADGPVLWRKSRGSPLWRGIRSVWHEMSTACQHSIRNEKDTSFWTARLLYSDVRLAKHALVRLTDEELAMSVADAANEEDGLLLGNPTSAAAGGIFCDHLGRPIATFSVNMGTCSIMRAELRAAEIGFRIAWDMGWRKV
ncbi:hypothetical protein LINPERHAP1_LOCUS21250, partial [Linum perenne]